MEDFPAEMVLLGQAEVGVITLKGLLELPILKPAKLLTSPETSQDSRITSISVIEIPVGEFIRPGEFVLSMGVKVGHNPRLLADFVKRIAQAEASAIALAVGPHTPQIPRRVIEVANRLGLPLIELPWEIRFSEISEAVLRQLIQQTGKMRSHDDFVWSLASRNISEEAAIAQGKHFGFDLNCKLIGILARLSKPVGRPEDQQNYARFVEVHCSKVASQNQLHWLGTVVGNNVIGYLQMPRTRTRLQSFLTAVQSMARDRCTITWGVGRICKEFVDFAKSYEDARIACELGTRARGPGSVTDVSDVLADRILFNLVRDPDALMLLNRYIEPLTRFKRIPLLRTLETFVDSDCNASETARKLSISRQSLLYRLRKVETLLDSDLHNTDNRFSILLSLRLHTLQRTSMAEQK